MTHRRTAVLPSVAPPSAAPLSRGPTPVGTVAAVPGPTTGRAITAPAPLLTPEPQTKRLDDITDPPPPVVVIDAGVGNLGNLRRALEALGAEVVVTVDPAVVAEARCLVLPGVGAFAPPREALRGALEEAIRHALEGGAWLLGICVGFQLLFADSDEFGDTDGLGLLSGHVRRLPDSVSLPHIGWNRLQLVPDANGGALLAGLPEQAWVYFVHSFAPRDVPDDHVLARTLHGEAFPAAVAHGRVMGTQFHPEKSGATGLTILGNFLRLARAPLDPSTVIREPVDFDLSRVDGIDRSRGADSDDPAPPAKGI